MSIRRKIFGSLFATLIALASPLHRQHKVGAAPPSPATQQAPVHIAELIARARTAAAEMGFGFDRSDAFVAIARVQVAAGDITGAGASLDDAWTAVVGTRIGDSHPDARCEIAAVLVMVGDAAGVKATLIAALHSAARIKDPHWRAMNYAEIALALSRTGDADGARAGFANALDAAGMEENAAQTSLYEDIAIRMARSGYLVEAKAVASKISDGMQQSKAWPASSKTPRRRAPNSLSVIRGMVDPP